MCSKLFWALLVFSLIFISSSAWENVPYKVKCFKDSMKIIVVQRNSQEKIYLEHLKNFPDIACKPVVNNSVATFWLSTAEEDLAKCGISRVVNLKTRETIYYHTVVVEDPIELVKSKIIMQCKIMNAPLPLERSRLNHTHSRRSVLPAGFQEDDTIDIGGVIAGSAPIPILSVGVRQGGNLVTGELNVNPGTPLQMEIFLNKESASVYGLLVTYMQVTDMKSAEETIIFNGCSVDPYLFENFNTVDGDFLAAKFRAFKFPESTYVQFRGTVNVCLDKCQGVECSNGQIGYGRKKRSVEMTRDRNNIFEVTMSTYIKVDYDSNTVLDKALLQFIRRGNNRTLDRPVIDEELREQFIYKLTETETNGSSYNYISIGFINLILFLCFFQVF